jgi:uncharacterized protein YkvS
MCKSKSIKPFNVGDLIEFHFSEDGRIGIILEKEKVNRGIVSTNSNHEYRYKIFDFSRNTVSWFKGWAIMHLKENED